MGRTAPSLWAAVELRRRWLGLVTLGLLAGLTAGLAMAAVAGARRTATAWDRLRNVAEASDAIVFASQVGLYRDEDLRYDQLASLPYVEAAGAFGLAYADQGSIFMTSYGDWLDKVDQPRIVEGRLPDRNDPTEAVISVPERLGVSGDGGPLPGLGDQVTLSFFTRDQQHANRLDRAEGPTVTFRIVGVGESPFEIAAIPSDGDMYVGPAFLERYGNEVAAFSNLTVRLADPVRDIRRLEADVARLYPGLSVPIYDLAAAGKRVTNGTGLERNGLLLFGAAVAVAGLVIVGQALTRSVRAAGGDVSALVAIGFTRKDAAQALALPYLLTVSVAAATATVVAIVLSPRFPIGLGRRVDPDIGLHVDLPVVAGGALSVGVVLVAAVVATAWRAAAEGTFAEPERQSLAVSTLLRLGAPVVAVTGASLALERGRGRRTLPTRPALVGAIAGVLGIIGAFTLATGIGDAVSHSERFGAVWDLEVNFAGEHPDDAYRSVVSGLASDPATEAVARVARVQMAVGDVVVPLYALDQVKGAIDFVLLDGRAPARSGDIVLGPDSARTLGLDVGDTLTLPHAARLQVVGLALLPTTPHSSFDQGAWVRGEDLLVAAPGTPELLGPDAAGLSPAELTAGLFEYGFAAARLVDDSDVDDTAARLSSEGGPTVWVDTPSAPADQENLRNVRALPVLFGAFATALAMGALAHVTLSVLRRRRGDLAVLRSLGCTPLQIRACVSWQAVTVVVIGIAFGVPLGVSLGRTVWRLVTDATPMIYVEPLAVLALILIVPVALLLATAVAAWPGHRAARMRLADVLRTE